MTDNINSDKRIQQLYNETKKLKSPVDLDNMILGKIRTLEEQPAPVSSEKSWLYLPIAASILLAVFLRFEDTSELEKPIKTVSLATDKKTISNQENASKNQLPRVFFVPQEDISGKIALACTGALVEPEANINILMAPNTARTEAKSSDLPIKLIYPNNSNKRKPACDRVSSQIFKQ